MKAILQDKSETKNNFIKKTSALFQKDKDPLLSLYQIHRRSPVPWARGRRQLTELFQNNEIKNIRRGTYRQPRYFSKMSWVLDYVKSKTMPGVGELKKATRKSQGAL